jgi:hypothetical protein
MHFKNVTRKHDWQKRLNKVFDQYEYSDFIWGKTDCFCFASDCIKAMTGYGPMDNFKTMYDDEELANKILIAGSKGIDGKFYKYNGLIGFWSSFLGEPKTLGGAMIGDIVLVDLPLQKDLLTGVINDTGRYVYLNAKQDYLVEVPVSRVKYIWGV